MIKISQKDLENALKWLQKNNPGDTVFIEEDAASVVLKATDPYGKLVKIELFDSERSKSFPQITRTERLTHE